MGRFLWYWPGLFQCRFRIAYIEPIAKFSSAKAGFTAGQSSFTAVPGRQHNCFPTALLTGEPVGRRHSHELLVTTTDLRLERYDIATGRYLAGAGAVHHTACDALVVDASGSFVFTGGHDKVS